MLIMLFELHDLRPHNPHLNIAMDEILSQHLAFWEEPLNMRGGLRLWCNPLSLILGRTNRLEDVVETTPPLQELQVARRISGGGAVLHSPACLNYSIFLSLNHYPALFSVQQAYQTLLGLVAYSLQAQDIPVRLQGSDLALQASKDASPHRLTKISGNAQFRKRGILALHGTLILHPWMIDLIERYMKHPPEEPNYRQRRSHRDFLTSLPQDFSISSFYNCLTEQFKRLTGEAHSVPLALEDRQEIYHKAHSLAKEQYITPEWIEKGQLPGNPRPEAAPGSYTQAISASHISEPYQQARKL